MPTAGKSWGRRRQPAICRQSPARRGMVRGMTAIIGDIAGLQQLALDLGRQSAIGLDTEFMRERTYFARLCLLQLSYDTGAVCVDTLALQDLAPLRASLQSRDIVKVLHAARQ